MSPSTRRTRTAAPPPTAEPGGRICLPLGDLIARVDTADAHGAGSIRLPTVDGGPAVDLPLHGSTGTDLRRLLAGASAHRFGTVRVTRGPAGPVVAVCRRRHRRRCG
jgi:hypothetical protein